MIREANLFDIIPSGFFNCLSSGSNNRIYADCLLVIYEQYDREITYRISRGRIRDALSAYLLENHINFLELDSEQAGERNYNDIANSVIRRFCSKDIGWLEEDNDDATYEKHIIMTEQGVLLTEFLQKLIKPEREEFSSYIFNIYNLLQNTEQWNQNPYVDGLKNIYRNARLLSRSLKRLATFIKKIIERMVKEESLESLTENLLDYCDGSFVREYARLTKQQNIHIYRSFIKGKLDEFLNDPQLNLLLISGCVLEEELEEAKAKEYVADMVQSTKRFLVEDYDRIMRDIKHKINIYLQIAVGRARFLRNREADMRGNVEQTLRYIVKEMDMIDWKETIPAKMHDMFTLDKHEFIDTGSLRYPRKPPAVQKETVIELEELTTEDIEKAKNAQEQEAYNPYAKEKMKEYLKRMMGSGSTISCENLPMQSKRDLLCALSAIAYSEENGYSIQLLDGYLDAHQMLLRKFCITKEDPK
ncbi:hypothetical protein IMSAGC013_01450 [Lachnospiraceae bacterium]|nr:hypothetical protein IMSAGC013_01450 [Lachnospiraceae bacterium]